MGGFDSRVCVGVMVLTAGVDGDAEAGDRIGHCSIVIFITAPPFAQCAAWRAHTMCQVHLRSWEFPPHSSEAERLKLFGFLLREMPVSSILYVYQHGLMDICFTLWILILYHFIFKSFQL